MTVVAGGPLARRRTDLNSILKAGPETPLLLITTWKAMSSFSTKL